MRILLVVNAFASSVTARNTVVVHRTLSAANDVELVETNRRGHATRFAQDAARRGMDAVIAFGGDGTLNEVATGVAGTQTAIGALPGGSTNVFARTIGMPNDPAAAAVRLAQGLATGDVRPIGLGHVNGRYFCFHTGVGYDAAVVREVERHASAKRWLGHPLFIYSSVKTWARGYDRERPHFTVESGGSGEFEGSGASGGSGEPGGSGESGDAANRSAQGYFTIVLNTNPYTYLGNRPLDLSPAATLERGLVVVTFTSMRIGAILRSLGGALRGGGVRASDHLDLRTDVAALTIHDSRPFPYQLDGDYLGETRRLDFEHRPDAVNLVMPSASEEAHPDTA